MSSPGRSGKGVAVGRVHNLQALPEQVVEELAVGDDDNGPDVIAEGLLPSIEEGEPNQFQIEEIQLETEGRLL